MAAIQGISLKGNKKYANVHVLSTSFHFVMQQGDIFPRNPSLAPQAGEAGFSLIWEQRLCHGSKLQMIKHIEITYGFFMLQIADKFPEAVNT